MEWKVSVPVELALNIEYLCFDPETDEPAYGERARLITKLLQDYWNALPAERRAKALLGKKEPALI